MARAALIALLLLTGCGRPLASCAAYIAVVGPAEVTLVCPPHGTAVDAKP